MKDCSVTFLQLEHWHKELFKKLGWMVLALHENDKMKIDFYKYSLDHFLCHMDYKLKIIKDKDAKTDLENMKKSAKILQNFVNKHLLKYSTSLSSTHSSKTLYQMQ